MLDSNSDGSGGSIMQWAGPLAAVMVTVVGAALSVPRLTSSRPPTPSDTKLEILGNQEVAARLWQDPFGLVEADNIVSKAKSEKDNSLQLQWALSGTGLSLAIGKIPSADAIHEVRRFVQDLHEGVPSDSVLLLPVMIDGDSAGEQVEQRLRARVAVDNALSICGYSPVEPRHIGYFSIQWPLKQLNPEKDNFRTVCGYIGGTAKDTSGDTVAPMLVPFERWEKALPLGAVQPWPPPKFKRVIVIWLAEELFSDIPLTRLAGLLETVRAQNAAPTKQQAATPTTQRDTTATTLPDAKPTTQPDATATTQPSITTRIVGPRHSETILAMLNEAPALRKDDELNAAFAGAQIFSATATAEESALQMAASSPFDSVAAAVQNEIKFTRTTLTDDDLTSALADELERRGITSSDPIAIVSEWDSFYGRALPFSFIAKFTRQEVNDVLNDPSLIPENVHRIRYLTGLDGRVAGERSTGSKRENSAASPESDLKRGMSTTDDQDDKPEGLRQADYLGRMTDELVEVDSQLRSTGRRLRAVGILGTDLYDKLLVLKAVRYRLPQAIFFTTGIDARYSLPEEWPATHNLICASSFGFRLNRYFQQGIMPFRDSDQTALFFGTLRAVLADDTSKVGKTLARRDSMGTARLFEIGHEGPVELTVDQERWLSAEGSNQEVFKPTHRDGDSLPVPPSVQPPRYNIASLPENWIWWGLAAALAIAVVIVVMMKSHPHPLVWVLVFGPLLAVIFVFALALAQPIRGEPPELFQGVNVWPAQALRLIAAVLSVYFTVWTIRESLKKDKQIEAKFKFPSAPQGPVAPAGGVKAKIRLLRRRIRHGMSSGIELLLPEKQNPAGPRGVTSLWRLYRSAADWPSKVTWAACAAVIFSLLAVLARHAFVDSLPPTRGELAYWADWFISDVAILCVLALTCLSAVASLLNAALIEKLTDPEHYPTYPDGAFDQADFKSIPIDYCELTEALTMRLLVMRTTIAGRTLLYPLIVLFILLIARAPIFADWKVSPVFIAVVGGCVAITLLSGWFLKRRTEDARERCWNKARQRSARLLQEGKEPQAKLMDRVAEYFKREDHGMFSSVLPKMFIFAATIAVWVTIDYLSQFKST